MTYLAQQDPFQPYDNPGKGKGNPHVPESSTYGLLFMGLMIILLIWRRPKR